MKTFLAILALASVALFAAPMTVDSTGGKTDTRPKLLSVQLGPSLPLGIEVRWQTCATNVQAFHVKRLVNGRRDAEFWLAAVGVAHAQDTGKAVTYTWLDDHDVTLGVCYIYRVQALYETAASVWSKPLSLDTPVNAVIGN